MAEMPTPHRPFDLVTRAVSSLPQMSHPMVDAMLKRIMNGEITAEQGLAELQQGLNVPPPVNGASPTGAPPQAAPQAQTYATSAPELRADDPMFGDGPPPMSPALERTFAAGDESRRPQPRAPGAVPVPPQQAGAPMPGPQNIAGGPQASAYRQMMGALNAPAPNMPAPPPRPMIGAPSGGLGALPSMAPGGQQGATAPARSGQRGLGAMGPLPGSDLPFTQAQADALLPQLMNMRSGREARESRSALETQKAEARTGLEREKMDSRMRIAQLASDSKYANMISRFTMDTARLTHDQQREADLVAYRLLSLANESAALAQKASKTQGDKELKILLEEMKGKTRRDVATLMAEASMGGIVDMPAFRALIQAFVAESERVQQEIAARKNVIIRDEKGAGRPGTEVTIPPPSVGSQQNVATPGIPTKQPPPKKAAPPSKVPAAQMRMETPQPLPKTETALVKGQVYQTARGPARWDGSKFTSVK